VAQGLQRCAHGIRRHRHCQSPHCTQDAPGLCKTRSWYSFVLSPTIATSLPVGSFFGSCHIICTPPPPPPPHHIDAQQSLLSGDTLVQNGATSIVGQCVVQLAKVQGIHTINIIRDRSVQSTQLFFFLNIIMTL
jgi:hypothetical protein